MGAVVAEGLNMNSGALQFDVGQNLYGLLYGNCKNGLMKWNLPMWFLPVLFAAQILHYGVDALLRRLVPSERGRRVALLCAAVSVLAAAGWNVREHFLWLTPFDLETVLSLYGFFLLGAALREPSVAWDRRLEERRSLRWLSLGLAAVLLAVSMAVGLRNGLVIYVNYDYGRWPLFCLSAVTGSLGLLLLAFAIGRSRVMETVGRKTMTVLCLHKFPLILLQMLFPTLEYRVFLCFLSCAGVVAMCLAADWIIARWFPFFLGDWYSKKPNPAHTTP